MSNVKCGDCPHCFLDCNSLVCAITFEKVVDSKNKCKAQRLYDQQRILVVGLSIVRRNKKIWHLAYQLATKEVGLKVSRFGGGLIELIVGGSIEGLSPSGDLPSVAAYLIDNPTHPAWEKLKELGVEI